ncbi:hypothetical protein WN944_017118 [Citrus x changshan-huyou]|uniref:Uncharacterized protein n=1 Tax=Citrus x changshan-huyou TaxID=2935761 RepID=A0AAP0MAQ9_9ROSI
MVSGSLLRSNRSSYAPLSTEDPGPSRHQIVIFLIQLFEKPRAVKFCIAEGRVKKCEILPCEWYFLGWCSSDTFSKWSSFGDGKQDQHMIEILTYEITDLLRGSEKRLHKLSAAGSSEDSNLRKHVQHSLATDLQNHSMDLGKNHSTYLKHLQQQKEIHIEYLRLQAERTQKKGGLASCATVLIIMCFIVLVFLILKELFL